MDLNLNGIKVSVAEPEIAAIVRQHLLGANLPVAKIGHTLPKIGDELDDGLYAGLTVHDNDPSELILLPGEFEGTWEKAKAWAEKQGGVLPSRVDLLILWQNLKGEFKPEWYWSAEPYAGDESYAWCQGFDGGGQTDYRKSSRLRARAVRRVAI